MPITTEPGATRGGENAVAFGPFRLLSAQRLLLEGDKPVRLGSRAFDILAALVERAGEVVGKEELIARAWPQTFVEEANLKIQVSALRRALGDGQGGRRYVVTVPGRGYNFVASVSIEEPARAAPSLTIPLPGAHNLPLAVTRMIGRDEAVATLVSRLSRDRLLTIVGPGGIGKTTVALAVAERIIADYQDGVWLVDLASLADPRLVPVAVATVLGIEIRTENPLPGLVAALRAKRMLLLLDSCEHVIDAAASLAAAVLTGVSQVNILATSREPLGVAGEREHRLAPLGSPPTSSGLTAAEALAFPAVQLFVERVSAIVEDFALTDANAPLVSDICQRLDGLPLAIEFAAPRVEILGVEGLAAELHHSLPLLTARRRATMPRHRTMRAVLDWSYGLLSGDEQRVFRQLGVFAGGFTVEAAAAVTIGAADARGEAIDRLADLVTKSLVVADVSGAQPRFRLLDAARAYALEGLDENGERERIARRHAEYYRNLFERAEGEAMARPTDEWLAEYAREIDNLRAALDWAFSPDGDGSIAVALTATAAPLWMHLSLLEECRSRSNHAFGVLGTEKAPDPRAEMRLQTALGASAPDPADMGAAFSKALEIAESLGDTEYQLRALRGLYFHHTGARRYSAAIPFAQKFYNVAASGSDLTNRLFGEQLMGSAKHFLGDHDGARRHLEQALTHDIPADRGREIIRFQDVIRYGSRSRVLARAYLARVLWLQGFPDEAVRSAEISVEVAQATGHMQSVCYALALAACPIKFWVGDLGAAANYTARLLELSRRHSLPQWGLFTTRFQMIGAIRSGDANIESPLGEIGFERIGETNFSFRFVTGLIELAEALMHSGRIVEGLALVEGIRQSGEGWLTPEVLRLKGELLLLQDATAAKATTENLFRQALDVAGRQGALSWKLRAATSLARLLNNQGRPADAIACLQPVYDRFTEGFGTADLMAARRLLDELGDAHHD